MKSIVLCGFMGSGKSTVGKRLARMMGTGFIDMDSYIEAKAGMSVSEIFSKNGEGFFRDMEHEACRELAERGNLIIASGGGALTFRRNIEIIKKSCVTVLLDAPIEILLKRTAKDQSRPLLQREDRAEAAKRLYDERIPVYREAADIVVESVKPPDKVAADIARAVKKLCGAQ